MTRRTTPPRRLLVLGRHGSRSTSSEFSPMSGWMSLQIDNGLYVVKGDGSIIFVYYRCHVAIHRGFEVAFFRYSGMEDPLRRTWAQSAKSQKNNGDEATCRFGYIPFKLNIALVSSPHLTVTYRTPVAPQSVLLRIPVQNQLCQPSKHSLTTSRET